MADGTRVEPKLGELYLDTRTCQVWIYTRAGWVPYGNGT